MALCCTDSGGFSSWLDCHLALLLLQSKEKQKADEECGGDEGHWVLKCYPL